MGGKWPVRYRVKVEWESEAGGVESAEIGEAEAGPGLSADEVGLKLVSAKEAMARLQELVMKQQLSRHCEHPDHVRNVKFVGALQIIEREPLILRSAFCKQQQMTWTRRAGAQALLHVKTAVINGTLPQHLATGGHRLKAAWPQLLYGLRAVKTIVKQQKLTGQWTFGRIARGTRWEEVPKGYKYREPCQ
jgi:hypothetical protein